MRSSESTSTEAVAAICGGLTDLVDVDVSLLPDQAVRDELLALVHARRQLDAQIAARVAAFDARNLAPTDGCRDVKAFLKSFARQTPQQTTSQLHTGRLLRGLPQLAAAARAGHAPPEHLRLVQDLVKDVGAPKAAALDEYLTQTVTTTTPRDMVTVCAEIRAWLDPDGPHPDPRKDYESRYLSVTPRGTHVDVRGRLDVEAGAALLTALDAILRPPTAHDERTPTQRRADAFADLLFAHLNAGTLPTVGGERPHLGVLISPAALTHQPGPPPTMQERGYAFLRWLHAHNPTESPPPPPGPQPPHEQQQQEPPGEEGVDAEDQPCGNCGTPLPPHPPSAWMTWIGEVPAAVAQRIACDATVWRIILDPATGQPLDVGRAHRLAPTWMRKALHARDRSCRFPGCDAPSSWTGATLVTSRHG